MKPTDAQLATIRSMGSAALPEIAADVIEIVPYIATDNFSARSRRKWSLVALQSIARLLVGKPFELNHDWYDVGAIRGLVFATKVLNLSQCPAEYMNAEGQGDINAQIYVAEGYHPVIAEVAFPASSSLLAGLQLGAVASVSIGAFNVTDYLCPACNTSFSDKHCSHYPPSSWRDDTEDDNVMPYAIRADTVEMGELSQVVLPDVLGAKAIPNMYRSLYGY